MLVQLRVLIRHVAGRAQMVRVIEVQEVLLRIPGRAGEVRLVRVAAGAVCCKYIWGRTRLSSFIVSDPISPRFEILSTEG